MGGKAVPASGVGGGGMNNGAMERTSGTGAFDDVHPWDSAMQGSNPSAGRASNPAGPGGGDIDWVGQPAGSSGKRKNPWGSGDRVPPRGPWSSLRFNNKPCREKSVGSSELPAFHSEPNPSQSAAGLLVARASWDTKIPRCETPAIGETRRHGTQCTRRTTETSGRSTRPTARPYASFHPVARAMAGSPPVVPANSSM